jgi:glycosyltransferase involved in cell wall biosynthesis
MRALHVYAGNLYGGVEAMLATLARRGDAGGMETRFALCFEGRLAAELRAAGAPPVMLGRVRQALPWTVLRARRRLARLLAESAPDVVVCHSAWSQGICGPVVRRAGLPLVFWLHDAPGEEPGREERRAARVPPELAICTSAYVQATLPRLFAGVPSAVVHPFVPAPPPGLERERAAVRAELATAEDAAVIVQVARMEPWKGHRLHLEALGRLREVPGWTAWLVGGAQRPHEARHLAELRALAASLGIADRVRFAGERGDVRRLLAAADVLCQPNLGPEPFGIAMVEGMHAGLPVVATALGGATEVVDASCGLLVPPGDAPALAAALRRMIEDPAGRRRLGTAGPARAHALCDPDVQIGRLREVLRAIPSTRQGEQVLRSAQDDRSC